jgi:hypothetical protein
MEERPQVDATADGPGNRSAEHPPHPPAQDHFPNGALVAVVQDMNAARRAADAARAAGGGDAYVLSAETVLREEDDRRARQNPVAAAVQLLGSLVSDQRAIQDRYLDHARSGRHMVVASAADEATAERVWSVLRDMGARDCSWYTAGVIREML